MGVFFNAILGGVLARSYRLDAIGFAVLAVLSGLGGGIIRDLLLQAGPPQGFEQFAGSSPDRPQVIARFTGGADGVLSGLMRNPDQIRNRPMVVDAPAGKGRVIAFNFNPMHRDLNHSDYRFLWNVILNWRYLVR